MQRRAAAVGVLDLRRARVRCPHQHERRRRRRTRRLHDRLERVPPKQRVRGDGVDAEPGTSPQGVAVAPSSACAYAAAVCGTSPRLPSAITSSPARARRSRRPAAPPNPGARAARSRRAEALRRRRPAPPPRSAAGSAAATARARPLGRASPGCLRQPPRARGEQSSGSGSRPERDLALSLGDRREQDDQRSSRRRVFPGGKRQRSYPASLP